MSRSSGKMGDGIASQPGRLVLRDQCGLLCGGRGYVPLRCLRDRHRPRLAARGKGDGLASDLAVGTGSRSRHHIPAALLPERSPPLAALAPSLWLAISLSLSFAIFSAFMPGEVSDVPGVANPLGIEALSPVLRVVD